MDQRAAVTPRFSRSLGYRLARREGEAGSPLRPTYAELTEQRALHWVVLLYRSGDTWTLNSTGWNDTDALFGP